MIIENLATRLHLNILQFEFEAAFHGENIRSILNKLRVISSNDSEKFQINFKTYFISIGASPENLN